MKHNVIYINDKISVPESLRNIADAIEDGKLPNDEATIIIGADVFHVGVMNDTKAAENAVWNMIFGIHKLMNAAIIKENE